ncbi:MAG: hypothetical protein JJU00_14755 [Opitutales bacterium]|nr:hypothetical protein [Opitutales bacterium]
MSAVAKSVFPLGVCFVCLSMTPFSVRGGDAVPVTVRSITAPGVSQDHSYSIVDDEVPPGPGSVIIEHNETEAQESTRILMLKPGHSYMVEATLPCLPSCSFDPEDHLLSMYFDVEEGYRIYVDTWESTKYDVYGLEAEFFLQVDRAPEQRLGEASAPTLRRGELGAGNVSPAELWMEFGVGHVFTGRAAPPLRLRADLTDGVDAALDLENYRFSRPYGVWYFISTYIRQVKKHDVVVDIRHETPDILMVRYFDSDNFGPIIEFETDEFPAAVSATPFTTFEIEKIDDWELRITASGEAVGDYGVFRDDTEENKWTVERLDVQTPDYIHYVSKIEHGSYPGNSQGWFGDLWETRSIYQEEELVAKTITGTETFYKNNVQFWRVVLKEGIEDESENPGFFELLRIVPDNWGRWTSRYELYDRRSAREFHESTVVPHFGQLAWTRQPFGPDHSDYIESAHTYNHQIPATGMLPGGGSFSYSERLSSRYPSKVEDFLHIQGEPVRRVGFTEFDHRL